MVESVRLPGRGRIRESKKTVGESTGKGENPCEYQKMVESVRVPGIGRIRESTKKLSVRVQKNDSIRVATKKW